LADLRSGLLASDGKARHIMPIMKLTIIQAGEVPQPLRADFGLYPPMFMRMFDEAGFDFEYDTVPIFDGAEFPDPAKTEAVIVTGSSAGVYEDHAWLEPLRAFIRGAYAANTPMLGVCFGHQIMADALGGDVRKSEKGWGLGRHTYAVKSRPDFLATDLPSLSIACSHQDQVIVPPKEAEVFLASEFTPNAGLAYRNGKAISLQPHPEFLDGYAQALAELRRGKAPDSVIDTAVKSIATPSHAPAVAGWLGNFLSR
jgi:GMP synthase-like glutamine amidotransferase